MSLVKFLCAIVLVTQATNIAALASVPESQIQDLIRALESPKEEVSLKAAKELGKIGSAREDVLIALTQAARNDTGKFHQIYDMTLQSANNLNYTDEQMCVFLLARLESPAIPKLEQYYKHHAWIKVIEALKKLGPAAKPATEALLKLQDESPLTHFLIETLVAIKADSAATIEFYAKATHNQSENVRHSARYGLEQLGAEAHSGAIIDEAVYRQNEYEIFKKQFESSDRATHKQGVDGLFFFLTRQLPPDGLLTYATKEQHAARGLLREEALRGDPELATPLIAFAARIPNLILSPEEALDAATKLPNKEHSGQLAEMLNSRIKLDKNNREAKNLTATEALDKYQRDLSGNDEESMLNALRQLAKLEKAALPVSGSIIKTLDNETLAPNIRIQAASALARIRPKSDEAQLALLAASRDKDPQLRRTSMNALTINTTDKSTLVPVFLKRLGDSSKEIQNEALLFLHAQQNLEIPNIQPFIEIFYAGDTANSMYAMDIVRGLKLPAEECRKIVIKDAIENNRSYADGLLKSLVSDRKEITLGMITLIEREQVVQRKVRLINLLALLKQDARAALPMLTALSNSSDEYLKSTAEKAIEIISSP